jgi:hypothetical protein
LDDENPIRVSVNSEVVLTRGHMPAPLASHAFVW